MAVHGLGITDASQRWNPAGETRVIDFNGDVLTVGVEAEGGKIPLNFILEPEIRRMFELGGAEPGKVDDLVRAFLEMRDGRVGGGLVAAGQAPPAPLTAIDQLALLKGMSPQLYARIAPQVTVEAATLAFDPQVAKPLALEVMAPAQADAPSTIERARDAAGERPALAFGAPNQGAGEPPLNLAGRAFTVRIDVADGHGAEMRRTAIVEFSGAPTPPFVVRSLD